MKFKAIVYSLLAAFLLLLGTQLFGQSSPAVRNSNNPPAFQKFAAPVSSRLAFLASEKGKQVLLASPNPMARALLEKYQDAEAAATWDKILHQYKTFQPPIIIRGVNQRTTSAADPTTVCPGTRFNLESATEALPQLGQTIDIKYQGGVSTAYDMVGEGATDWRGLFNSPAVWTPGMSAYYFETASGCTPSFEGALPPIPDPLYPATEMWGMGDPILNYNATNDAWFYSSVFEDPSETGVGVFRNTTNLLKNSVACRSGSHNLPASKACWPLSGGAQIVDEHTSSGFTVGGSTVDWPDSWVDPRSTGTGAGDVYITDTVLAGGGSSIDLTACRNDLSKCSSSITISSSDSDAQFSDVKTKADGTITITYGNYSTEETPSTYAYIDKVDIKYVVCTPNGAPSPPSCSAPALVATEEQPVSLLAELTDVNNNTYPVHVERTKDGYTFVFWERCATLSDLPFGGALGHGATCPDADIVGAYSTNEGGSWTPINVDKTPGHQIMPWAAYDADRDVISIAYQDCNFPDTKQACRVVYQQIPSGYTATSGLVALTSYSYPEDEANRSFFKPLFGDHIGATAWNGHLWVGYTDTLRLGLYGYGTQPLHEANNNVAAQDY